MTTITRETWERMGQDRALADALDPQPGAPKDWTIDDLARFFADGAQAAEKQAAEQIADLRHQLQDMERERDVSRGNAQMHMEAARDLAVQLEAAQAALIQAAVVARVCQGNLGASRNMSGLDDDQKQLWDWCQLTIDAAAIHKARGVKP